MKINQQSKSLVGQTQISQQLLPVNRCQRFYRLDLDNDLVFNNQIAAEAGVDTDSVTDDRDRLLASRAKSAQLRG